MISEIKHLQHHLTLLFSISVASGFMTNFDLLSPTIVSSGVTDGEAISFGFSLAQHALSNGSMIALVGAPKADSASYVREGGAFRCPFINGSTCQFETLFQSREDADTDPFKFPLSSNNLSNVDQLLGYSLRSLASGRVVACAPLYVSVTMEIRVQGSVYSSGTPEGRCVILLNQDLLPTDDAGLVQVLQLSDIGDNPLSFAGLDTGSLNVSEVEYLALGSAGSGESPIPAGRVYMTELSPSGIGRPAVTLSSPSLNAPALPLTGYHIETGYFTVNTGTQQIATSAPRGGNHMGQIQIMSVVVGVLQLNPVSTISGDESWSRIDQNLITKSNSEIPPILTQIQVDGYFGYDFAVLDTNSQGYHSLVVGCPLCAQERGRIYIFTHTGDSSSPFTKSSIDSPSSMRGRFGLAVENIGDIDSDGYTDVAVSAPYVGGEGVVYIFRGAGDHLVSNDYQEIPAVPNSKAFGYSLSGGLDIDSNGYADVSIGDLSGNHVITFRSSPLVTVTMEFQDLRTLLDIAGDADRRCPLALGGSVNLLCFDVTPCFYHESSEVNEFAVSYTVIVDEAKKRFGLYKRPASNSDQAELTTNEISGNVTIRGTGRENRVCPQTYTFALSADFTETSPVPVDLSISDVPQPLPLTSDPETERLGGALHPILRRYVAGDQPLPLSLLKEVSFNLNCSGGSDPDLCEPNYEIDVEKEFGDVIPLASTNEFGYRVRVTNSASDDGLNPTLLITLPQGVLLNRYVSISPNALTSCNTRAAEDQKTTIECGLSNPTLAGSTLQLEIYFTLNDSAIPLSKRQLEMRFSVVDGVSQTMVAAQAQIIGLTAVAGFKLSSSTAEESYQAYRSIHFIKNISTTPLNETGPLINLRVSIENARHTSNGTTIPQSILKIYLPVEVTDRIGGERRSRPLIVPTEVLTGLGNVNCSEYNAIPSGLPLLQRPPSFLPAWTGSPLPPSPSCEMEGQYRCGVIVCTITELKPAPAPAIQITLFARLYSLNVVNGEVTIVSEVEASGPESPRIEQDTGSNSTSQVTFRVSQAITDVPRDCIQYWVVVVPVVIGIFALTVIIAVLGFCGLFKRWRNFKKLELTEETDGGFAYHHRAIPPIPGLNQNGAHSTGTMKEEESVGGASDKEREAEAEAEMELEIMTRAATGDDIDEPDIPPQLDPPAPPGSSDEHMPPQSDPDPPAPLPSNEQPSLMETDL